MSTGFPGRPAMAQAEKASPSAEKGATEEPKAAAAPQAYIEDPVDEEQKKNRLNVSNVLRKPRLESGDKALLDAYYKTYALARWSLQENRNLLLLPGFRKDLRNELITGKRGEAHDYLNALAIDFLGRRARRHYHPATRFNAMLMIGDLNSVEPLRASDVPVPLPKALPILLKTVEDPSQSDAVKVAALIGIMRHVRLGGVRDRRLQEQVFKLMCKVAGPRSAPNRSDDGHAWMRTLAVELLGEVGFMGENGKAVRGLSKIVADSKTAFSTRCAAARALGQFSYRGASGLNPSQMAAALGELVVDACEAEGPVISRRRMKFRLHCTWVGLTGVDENRKGVGHLATKPPHKEFVDALRETLKTMLDLLEDRNVADLADKIEENKEELQKVLDNKPK